VGRLEAVANIGLIPYPFATEICVVVPEDFDAFPPPRPLDGHKGMFGHLSIVAGSFGYHGAAVLAARGSQRAQPGLITVITEDKVYNPVAEQLQSAMVKTVGSELQLPAGSTAVVIGPGLAAPDLSPVIRETTIRLWQESPLAVIVDASALDWLPPGPCPANSIRLITPHPGEAARMLQSSSSEVQGNRAKAVRDLSRKWGDCYVVLKGHQTMMGRTREQLFVNCSGNPQLAQGGSGDLLAGYLGGLLAQPALQKQPGKTIQYGVWQHGAAADLLAASRPNWTIEDLAEVLGSAPALSETQ
jgi:NAD(P)H-hydrate epimerase